MTAIDKRKTTMHCNDRKLTVNEKRILSTVLARILCNKWYFVNHALNINDPILQTCQVVEMFT